MTKFIIRNDDVAFDTNLEEIQQFCEICDKYGYQIIQAITPLGKCRKSRASMTSEAIKRASKRKFEQNSAVVKFLRSRNDFIGVHGLWHTHEPSFEEITTAKSILEKLGFTPTYFVPPFNEGHYPSEVGGLTTCQLSLENGDRLEDFLKVGLPTSPIMYLHSWRFDNKHYTFDQLDQCLRRLSTSSYRLWYNDWVKANAQGKVLDVGKSKYWDYGSPTLDINLELNPTYYGNIEHTDFADETFDVVLCNGMYEFVDNPQKMIDEVLRITRKGGKAIFGFVGRDYKPYRKPWKFYEGKETLPAQAKKDFGQEYHFVICEK